MTIDILPAEILSDVFILSVLSYASVPSKPNTTQVLLGHVCSHWRQVLSETPQLWTEITIKSSSELDVFDLRAACVYISRCGQVLPLTLRVHWGDIDPDFGEDGGSFKNLITADPTRWINISIRLFSKVDGVGFLMDMMRGFTSLTTLEFSLPQSCAPPQDIAEGNVPDWDAAIDICEQSCIPRFALPSLLNLTLDFESCCNTSLAASVPVLYLMMAPSLSSFTLRMHPDDDFATQGVIWSIFVEFLKTSNYPPLRTIYSSYYCLWSGIVVRHTPHLEAAHNLYFGSSEWEALALTAPGQSSGLGGDNPTFKYAPNLSHLYISQIPSDRIDLLVQILSSRWRGGAGALKIVTVTTEYILNSQSDEFLRRVKEELVGLEIIVR